MDDLTTGDLGRLGYTSVPTSIILDPSLSLGARTLYMLILSYPDPQPQAQLAADLGIHTKSVRKYLAELRARGLLSGGDGYVYIIEGAGLYKIGKATNVAKRLESHQTSCPIPLTLVHTIKTRDALSLERHLQHHFRHKATRGEWFRLDEVDLTTIRKVQPDA
jgi:Mn-dependent DtxR family transcriptional regulator